MPTIAAHSTLVSDHRIRISKSAKSPIPVRIARIINSNVRFEPEVVGRLPGRLVLERREEGC